MNKPSAEYLVEVMTQHGGDAGYQKLRREGYDISRSACAKVRRELVAQGIVRVGCLFTNEQIAQVREMAALGKPSHEIGKLIGASSKQVWDLCYRLEISLTKGRPMISLPDRDKFNAVYQTCSIAKAAEIFGVSPKVGERWVKALGLKRERKQPVQKRITPKAVHRRNGSGRKFGVTYTATPIAPPTETGPLADAARYLRQQGYANVYRRSRDEWQVGARVMLEKDMLARVDEMKARRARLAGSAA